MSGGVPAGERRDLSHHEQMLDAQSQCLSCKLCGGKAIIRDAGIGAGYYIACENGGTFRSSDGCLINDRRLGGCAYNVMEWWNRLMTTPTPPIEGRDADVERENMRWFSGQRRLSLDFYSPMYGDDDDQSEEWRVTQESGPINDREWDVIGRGQTVFEAVASARAALQALGERG